MTSSTFVAHLWRCVHITEGTLTSVMRVLKYVEFVDKMCTYHNSTNVPYDMDISPVLGKVLAEMQELLLAYFKSVCLHQCARECLR